MIDNGANIERLPLLNFPQKPNFSDNGYITLLTSDVH